MENTLRAIFPRPFDDDIRETFTINSKSKRNPQFVRLARLADNLTNSKFI